MAKCRRKVPATKQSRQFAHLVEVIPARNWCTYRCRRCGLEEGSTLYSEAAHLRMISHAKDCDGEGQAPIKESEAHQVEQHWWRAKEAFHLWHELAWVYPELAGRETDPDKRKMQAEQDKTDLFGPEEQRKENIMPIKGLTDKQPQFAEIGHLRKGAPRAKGSKRPGPDLTFFRATFLDGEEEAANMFYEAYGEQPREINVVLPFDGVDANFEAWREAYLAGGLIHRCDGENVIYAIDPDTGDVLVKNGLDPDGQPVRCNGDPVAHWMDSKGKRQPVYCKPVGRLKVIIPELHRLAYVTALTGSVWDVLNLSRQLEAIRYTNNGRLRGIPLVLKRRPRQISTPSGSNGKRARREKWLLSIEPDRRWVEAQLEAMRVAALPGGDNGVLELPPGIPEPREGVEEELFEAEVIQREVAANAARCATAPVDHGEANVVARYAGSGSLVSSTLPTEMPPWALEVLEEIKQDPKTSDPVDNGFIQQLHISMERKGVTPERGAAFIEALLGHRIGEMTFGEIRVLMNLINERNGSSFEEKVAELLGAA